MSYRHLLCLSVAAALRLDIPSGPNSLVKAQALVRREIEARSERMKHSGQGCEGDDIIVLLGPGRHGAPPGGLVLSSADSGVAGCYKVVWAGSSSTIDGGVDIISSWTLEDPQAGLWSTPAPQSLLGGVLAVRTMYVDGVRYNRTRDSPGTFGILGNNNSVITPTGYVVTSTVPQTWTDPTSIEFVKQGPFTQDRCPVASVTALPPTPASRGCGGTGGCSWGQKLAGRSPGSTMQSIANLSYADCQAECCKRANASTPCKGILYKDTSLLCYLVDRDVLSNFSPGAGFVSNMNPAPVAYRTAINISVPCITMARGYKWGPNGYPDYLENTGTFSSPGQFYLDRKKGVILATLLPEHAPPAGGGAVPAVMGLNETLLTVSGAHDLEWRSTSFAHTGWTQANADGYVERFSNLFLTPAGYRSPKSAVSVKDSRRIVFDGCNFTRLGAFGIRIYNGSQDVVVKYCNFMDSSGGAVMLGDPNENEAPVENQNARITIADNSMTHLSLEYSGAAAVHSMTVANSTLEHNYIRDVGYCGISWNWPKTQGPTLPYPPTNPALGYNMNNVVRNNDVSFFMRDTTDGGGIHSVGWGHNTTYTGNYFHDVETDCVSILYLDNFAAGFQLNNNVVDNCPNTVMGNPSP